MRSEDYFDNTSNYDESFDYEDTSMLKHTWLIYNDSIF